jgi:hypothetical protein
MNFASTLPSRAALSVLFIAALVALAVPRANAQVPITWDHYKVYEILPPGPQGPTGLPLTLTDQFGVSQHTLGHMVRFQNPVMKIDGPLAFPITDPRTHYAWWEISPQPYSNTVVVSNQFGDQTLIVGDALYLWTPALKNESGPLPVQNHYKCYACQGQPVNRPVGLQDQFDQPGFFFQTNVLFPRFLCNPVEKQLPSGLTFQVIDPDRHYVVYDFNPIDTRLNTAVMMDQFAQGPMELQPSRLLAVPSFKHLITATSSRTWGQLKMLYR